MGTRSLTRRGSLSNRLAADDLVVVPGGVGEGALAVAVPHRPDVLGAGAQLVVDDDVAAAVDLDSGQLQTEIVGVGPTPHRHQQVRAGDGLRTFGGMTSKPLSRLSES